MKIPNKQLKKEKLFPIWCSTEDQKNILKEKLESLRKINKKSNYHLIIKALETLEE